MEPKPATRRTLRVRAKYLRMEVLLDGTLRLSPLEITSGPDRDGVISVKMLEVAGFVPNIHLREVGCATENHGPDNFSRLFLDTPSNRAVLQTLEMQNALDVYISLIGVEPTVVQAELRRRLKNIATMGEVTRRNFKRQPVTES